MSQEDNGDYNCSGFDVIMGNHFYSTTNLVATDPGKSCKYLFECLAFAWTVVADNEYTLPHKLTCKVEFSFVAPVASLLTIVLQFRALISQHIFTFEII